MPTSCSNDLEAVHSGAIWWFAVAMADPVLPGAEIEAFKGLSVLIGPMPSLGAASVIGQPVNGRILTYFARSRM